MIDAQRWTASNPDETAHLRALRAGQVPAERVAQILRSHTHGHASTGAALREEIVGYAKDLKIIKVLSANLDINKYAQAVVPNVLG